MALYKTRAIVIKSINLSESDRLVTFFTKNYGKVKCVAKGARKAKNCFWGSLEPMSLIHLIYFGKETQSLYRLNHADIVESFQSIRDDFGKLYKGIYFLELVDSMILEGHPEKPIFNLLQETLLALKQETDLDSLIRLFEVRMLSLSGFKPQIDHCVNCKTIIESGTFRFSFIQNGILCRNCSRTVSTDIQFTMGTRNYIKKLMEIEIKTCGRIKIPKQQEEDKEKFTHRLVLSHIGREKKSYPFIKTMAQSI
jgi:DNA repair protein RecO (recombination protein O)